MNIGKAKIDVVARGCIDCGAEHASGWTTARLVTFKGVDSNGRKVGMAAVWVSRCADCQAKKRSA